MECGPPFFESSDLKVHDLRHSYASALVNQGHTLYDTQRLLGHSSSRMTKRYAHLATDRLLEVAENVSLHYKIPSVNAV
jgi:site-specific recombinase XerD